MEAKRDLRLARELRRLDRYACLCLDDIGYVRQDRAEMDRVVHHSVILELTVPRPPELARKTRRGEVSRMNAAGSWKWCARSRCRHHTGST